MRASVCVSRCHPFIESLAVSKFTLIVRPNSPQTDATRSIANETLGLYQYLITSHVETMDSQSKIDAKIDVWPELPGPEA